MSFKHALLGSIFLLFAASPGVAAPAPNPILSSYYVEGLPDSAMRLLFEKYDVETRRGAGYEVILPAARASELFALAPRAVLLERDIDDVFRRLDRTQPGWRVLYRNFDSVQKELQQIADTYPQIASVENYGTTDEGYPNLVLRLASPAALRDGKPEILITSLTHGNEFRTVEVVMEFVHSLLTGYGADSRTNALLDNHVLYFIPVVAPDGYVHGTRWCNGVDPNRNYPYPGNPDHKPVTLIQNKIDWLAKHQIAGALSVHGYLSTVMYPWSHKSSAPDAADVERFQAIGKVMAQDTGYNFGQISHVFGIAVGASDDYMYWKGHTLSFGYEIGGYRLEDGPGTRADFRGDHDAFRHFIEAF